MYEHKVIQGIPQLPLLMTVVSVMIFLFIPNIDELSSLFFSLSVCLEAY